MLVLTITCLVLGLLVAVFLLANAARAIRKPPELTGDWWSQFEREFRAYVQRMAPHDPPPHS